MPDGFKNNICTADILTAKPVYKELFEHWADIFNQLASTMLKDFEHSHAQHTVINDEWHVSLSEPPQKYWEYNYLNESLFLSSVNAELLLYLSTLIHVCYEFIHDPHTELDDRITATELYEYLSAMYHKKKSSPDQ